MDLEIYFSYFWHIFTTKTPSLFLRPIYYIKLHGSVNTHWCISITQQQPQIRQVCQEQNYIWFKIIERLGYVQTYLHFNKIQHFYICGLWLPSCHPTTLQNIYGEKGWNVGRHWGTWCMLNSLITSISPGGIKTSLCVMYRYRSEINITEWNENFCGLGLSRVKLRLLVK